MRSLLFLGVLLGFSISLAQAAPTPYDLELGRYHALIISNQDYKQLSPLKTPHGDADALATLLRNDYGFKVTSLRDINRAGTLDALDQLVEKLTPNDNLLIFYAGHGHLDSATGEGYWLPVTASPSRRSEWISNSDITDTLRATVAKHVLVVSDSCFSGTLSRSASAGLRVSQNKRSYYAKLASRTSRTSLSSGGLEPVDDGGSDGHSVFAGALISALRRNNEPLLEAENLYGQIKRPVALNSSAIQKPQYSDVRATGHDEGDFLFFKRNIRAVAKPAEPVNNSVTPETTTGVDTEAAYELAFWNSIKGSKDARDFSAYLETYPQGQFSVLAKLRTRQLAAKSIVQQAPEKKKTVAVLEPVVNQEKIAKKKEPQKIISPANNISQTDTVLLVLATPDSEYSPEFDTIAAYSNAVADLVKTVLKEGSLTYVAKQDVAWAVIQEDDGHVTSKQLCQQYQAQRVMSIELNLVHDGEVTRTSDSVYVGLYDCDKQRYNLKETKLDFQLGEEFTYAAGLRSSLNSYKLLNQ